MNGLRAWLVLPLLLMLGACAVPAQAPAADAVAAPGLVQCRADLQGRALLADRGIGGTGQSPAPMRRADRGIGGTGGAADAQPDLGVLATITGFASICTAGLEIATDPGAEVLVDGARRSGDSLRVGQVAAVTVAEDTRSLQARRVAVLHEVSGPVEALVGGAGPASASLVVAGQKVRLAADTQGNTAVGPGDWVEVSGLRDADGAILASRIDGRSPGLVTVTGQLARHDRGWQLGGLRIVPPAGLMSSLAGQRVTLTGRIGHAGLVVSSLSQAAPLPFAAGVRRFLVEGIAQPGGRGVRIGQDLDVATGPAFGLLPAVAARTVLELELSASGDLVAIGHRDVTTDHSGLAAPTAALAAAHAAAVAAAAHAGTVAAAAAASHNAAPSAAAAGHALDRSGDKATGDKAGGDKAGGDKAAGDKASGDKAAGGGDRGGDKGGRR